MRTTGKVIAGIVGVVLIFTAFGVGMVGNRYRGIDQIVFLAIGVALLGAGWALLNWATGWSRRWRAYKAKRNAPKYPPKGGGM